MKVQEAQDYVNRLSVQRAGGYPFIIDEKKLSRSICTLMINGLPSQDAERLTKHILNL